MAITDWHTHRMWSSVCSPVPSELPANRRRFRYSKTWLRASISLPTLPPSWCRYSVLLLLWSLDIQLDCGSSANASEFKRTPFDLGKMLEYAIHTWIGLFQSVFTFWPIRKLNKKYVAPSCELGKCRVVGWRTLYWILWRYTVLSNPVANCQPAVLSYARSSRFCSTTGRVSLL